jgi:uncharacterized protein (DUF2147 family)
MWPIERPTFDAVCAIEHHGRNRVGHTRAHPTTFPRMIRNTKRSSESAVWEGGEILDPDKGKTYRLQLAMLNGGKQLQVRGFIGPFFRTQVWLRVQ